MLQIDSNEIIVEMLTCPLLPLVAESGDDWREHGTINKSKYYNCTQN